MWQASVGVGAVDTVGRAGLDLGEAGIGFGLGEVAFGHFLGEVLGLLVDDRLDDLVDGNALAGSDLGQRRAGRLRLTNSSATASLPPQPGPRRP